MTPAQFWQIEMNNRQMQAEQAAQQQQQIGEAIRGIGEGFTKARENKMTSEYLDQMANQFAQTPGMDGKTPLMSQEELDKFSKMSLSAKQGMIVPKQAMFDQSLKNQYLAAQIQGFGQRQSMQNQVPANQVPMSPSANPAPATNPSPAPAAPYSFNPQIRTSPAN